jgi:predicted TIM-barrel fold metal-dependent hydrolase
VDKIDPHHHLWDLEHNPYPWLQHPDKEPRTYGDYSAMCRSFLIEDYLELARAEDIVKSVHVQANWDASDPVGETAWCQAVADEHGFPHGIVGFADLSRDTLRAELEQHMSHRNFRGIRHILGRLDDPDLKRRDVPNYLEMKSWAAGFGLLGELDLSFDLQAMPPQMKSAAKIGARYEDVVVIVCHTGLPWNRSAEGIELWRNGMRAIAELPNSYAKLSGPAMVMPDWSVDSFGRFIHETIDIFSPDRCMFASNVPPDGLHQSFTGIYVAFDEWASRYDEAERRAMFHDVAERVYRL